MFVNSSSTVYPFELDFGIYYDRGKHYYLFKQDYLFFLCFSKYDVQNPFTIMCYWITYTIRTQELKKDVRIFSIQRISKYWPLTSSTKLCRFGEAYTGESGPQTTFLGTMLTIELQKQLMPWCIFFRVLIPVHYVCQMWTERIMNNACVR